MIHDRHPIAQLGRLFHVVSGEHHGLAARLKSLDEIPQRPARLRIETRGRLIEEDEFGVVHQRQGDRKPLLLAPRQVHRPSIRSLAEVHRVDQLLRGHAMLEEAAEQIEQLGHGQARIQRDALELDADTLLDRLWMVANIEAEHLNRAGLGRSQALENLDRRRLAGAVRAQHAEDFAACDLEAHAVHGLHVAVELSEVGDAYNRRRVERHLTPWVSGAPGACPRSEVPASRSRVDGTAGSRSSYLHRHRDTPGARRRRSIRAPAPT